MNEYSLREQVIRIFESFAGNPTGDVVVAEDDVRQLGQRVEPVDLAQLVVAEVDPLQVGREPREQGRVAQLRHLVVAEVECKFVTTT